MELPNGLTMVSEKTVMSDVAVGNVVICVGMLILSICAVVGFMLAGNLPQSIVGMIVVMLCVAMVALGFAGERVKEIQVKQTGPVQIEQITERYEILGAYKNIITIKERGD